MKVSRKQLEGLWEEATEMPADDGLNRAIVEEAWCEGGDGPEDIVQRLFRIAQDCDDFAQRIREWALEGHNDTV